MMLTACNQSVSHNDSTFRIKLPWVNGKGFSIQIIELFSLHDTGKVSGEYARFYIGPTIENGYLTGRSPSAKLVKNSDGIFIPADSFTLELYSVYAHLEKLALMDKEMGLQNELIWPRQVGVAVNISEDGEPLLNNALYDNQIDALLIVPFSKSTLPLTVNAGVMAHEHFHSIFNALVIKPLKQEIIRQSNELNPHSITQIRKRVGVSVSEEEETSQDIDVQKYAQNAEDEQILRTKYLAFLLRAINEGLADVWAWLYANQDNFIQQSLPEVGDYRNLAVEPNQIWTMDYVKVWSAFNRAYSDQHAYELGTNYALAFRNLKNLSKKELGNSLIKTLKAFTQRFKTLKNDEYLRPAELIEIFVAENTLDKESCLYLKKLISDDPATKNMCGE